MTRPSSFFDADSCATCGGAPHVTKWLYNGFARYARRLIRRRFHAMRVTESSLPSPRADDSMLIYTNHASWWDPLMAVVVNELLFAPRQFHAPIDEEALQQYAVLGRLGFFPVRKHADDGALVFQLTMLSILKSGASAFITPEGQFTDVRADIPFRPGLAHLLAGLPSDAPVMVLPMAVEYVFWNESTPEILIEFGEPMRPEAVATDCAVSDWDARLRHALRTTQSQLAQRAMARSDEPFRTLVVGAGGERGLYDIARRLKSWLSGHRFSAEHDQNTPTSGAVS